MTTSTSGGATTNPRRRRRQYTRASLVNGAVEAFNERGYDGTSMEFLSDRLGITKSSIYHHVVSKAELYTMVLEEAARTLRPLLRPGPCHRDPVSRLRDIVRSVLMLPTSSLAPVELLLTVRDGREAAPGALAHRKQVEELLGRLLQEALALRPAAADIPVEVRTRLLVAMLHSLIAQRRRGTQTGSRYEDADSLADLVLRCAL